MIGADKEVYERKEVKMSRNELEVVGNFRMGNETRGCEYWKREEEKLCRLCEEEEKSMRHEFKECEITGNGEEDWKKYLKGDTRSIGKVNEIIWKRKRCDGKRRKENIDAPNG